METRDNEIDRLSRMLEGGRPYDVVALETRNRSNERLISHLNIQVSDSIIVCMYVNANGETHSWNPYLDTWWWSHVGYFSASVDLMIWDPFY